MAVLKATIAPLALLLLGAPSAWPQSVISAHSGVVHYLEGEVTIDGNRIQPKFGEFPDVAPGKTLSTLEGRAEVLLNPGVFFRMSENSSFRMISNQLTDTQVELLSGSVLIEVAELQNKNAISVQVRDSLVALRKKGLYRFDAASDNSAAPRLRVFEGEARVGSRLTADAKPVAVKKGREAELGSSAEIAKFDPKSTDPFYRWGSRRSDYIAQANLSAARSEDRLGLGYGSGFTSGRWAWNPWFGNFTYLPASGIYQSPFGSSYYSPAAFQMVYFPSMRQSIGFPAASGPGPMMSPNPGVPQMASPRGTSSMGAPMGPPAGGGLRGGGIGGGAAASPAARGNMGGPRGR